MRIPGYFNKRFQPPAPFIRITVESKSQRIKRPLHFHIDTGASLTVLLDKDTSYLGIDVEKLKRAERNIGGLGGLINTYVIEDATLFFRAEDGEVIEEKLCLFVGAHDLSKTFPGRKGTDHEDTFITRQRHHLQVQVVCDRNRNEIYLER
jgi:hypothetical protein